MERILFPTDFSENARIALGYAAEIAGKIKAKLLLYHCLNDLPVITQKEDKAISQIKTIKKEAIQNLFDFKELIQELFPAIDVDFQVSADETVPGIIKMAKSTKASLIVMGTKGANNFNRLLLGTNSTKVLKLVSCPVLLVPENASWGDGLNKIVLAVDLSRPDLQSVMWLANFTKKMNASLILLYVSPSGKLNENDKMMMGELQIAVENILAKDKVAQRVIQGKDIFNRLIDFMEESKAGLLALTTRKRGKIEQVFNWSLTRKMAQNPIFPILALFSTDNMEE